MSYLESLRTGSVSVADGGLFVYKCAQDAHEQITRLSDFVSPTVVAMWNLRWQVNGFLDAYPRASQEDLVARFALGSGVRGNEIRRACVDITWEKQKARFASILLMNTISIFEEFTDRIASLAQSGLAKDKASRDLQFPTVHTRKGYQRAYTAFGPPVPELSGVFVSNAGKGPWYSGTHVQNLLLCFRFFKEIRNAAAHNGGRANAAVLSAYQDFAPIATVSQLGVKEVPTHNVPILDQIIEPDLRGVNSFSNITLRLIATYDRDLSDRAAALKDVDGRLLTLPPADRSHSLVAGKTKKKLEGLLTNSRLPKAVFTPGFLKFLKDTHRIPNHW